MLLSSILSFSHNVFKRLPLQGRYKLGLCGKELNIRLVHFDTSNSFCGSRSITKTLCMNNPQNKFSKFRRNTPSLKDVRHALLYDSLCGVRGCEL